MEKQYNFVYVTTNLINGKQYVGDHSTNNLDDGYLGSGVKLKNSIKKHKKENFQKEILEFFNSKEEAYGAQEKWINEYNTINNGYNISPKGGLGVPNSFHNEETKIKIGLAHKGKEGKEIRKYNQLFKKGRTYEEQLGKEKALAYKHKISENTSGENNPMYGKGYLILGEKNGMYGNTHSIETKNKQSKRAKNRKKVFCEYCEKTYSPGMYGRWHGKNCKLKKEL